MTLAKRLRIEDGIARWVDVDVPEGPHEYRERAVSSRGAHVSDPTNLIGALTEAQLERLRRVELMVQSGELDSVRWTLEGTPESRALHCDTWATATI